MAAYASLVSLMQVIHDLETHPSPPISLDKQLLDSITQHVTCFQEFLQSFNTLSPPAAADDDEEAADPLEMRIAGAAYAAEDAIESHIVDCIQHQRSDFCSLIARILNCFPSPKPLNLCSVVNEMDSIKKAVNVQVKTENKDMVVHNQVLESVAVRNETMAGSDAVLLEIMEKLTRGRPDLQAIPIVGMGGIGKTFLVKTIFTKPFIREHFDICAWATISQQYDSGEILRELLSQATKEQPSGKSEGVLGLQLHKYLFCRRFLIVMDDMWRIDAYDKIQSFFPNNQNGSRVLVTTRLSQLSSQLNSNDYSLRMSFLDKASSWELFSKTVFGENNCPPELKNIGEKIVDNCRGLPLSIAVVGGILKKVNATPSSWESIRDNFTSVVNMDNDKHCLRLLKLSYNHLPVYLKPCFLYMGVFEEDKKIRVSSLVKLWVSEGFLKATNGEALETSARGFLQDLIDRNLILMGDLGTTGSLRFCKMHDLVRDMCLKEGQKEGFYHVIGKCNPPLPQGMINAQRRVVIPRYTSAKKVCDELRSMPHARLVIGEYHKLPPGRNLGLLRILHTYSMHAKSISCNYVNLRHLDIIFRGDDISSFLPSASFLWNLHTLIVSGSPVPYLLVNFWKMPRFRHIEFSDGCLCLPDLPSDDDDAVVIMENLHTLKGVYNLACCEEVVKRLPNVKKLKIRYLDKPYPYHYLDRVKAGNVKSLCRLESLSIVVKNYVGGGPKLTFPHSLKKLSLQMIFTFNWPDRLETIGSLPLLEKLIIDGGNFFWKREWKTAEGQFPCLKHLELRSCLGFKHWTAAEEGSNILPHLEYLALHDMKELEKIPYELGNIDTLKSIKLIYCGEGAVKSAKEMVQEQVESQGVEQIDLYVQTQK